MLQMCETIFKTIDNYINNNIIYQLVDRSVYLIIINLLVIKIILN